MLQGLSSIRGGVAKAWKAIASFPILLALLLPGALWSPTAAWSAETTPPEPPRGFIILFVLEGVGQEAVKSTTMPTLNRLVKEGSVTWSASTVQPPLRLPAMASLLTGLPVERHGVTWNTYDFALGYPRPPTVFDYLDLSGGKDSAIFFMDEALYQLAKPEPYTDYQMCGPLRPECNTGTVVHYIKDYFRKATSGHGYGHAILSLPHFLVVHLPEPARAGSSAGWQSKPYREALKTVDSAMNEVLQVYRDLDLYKDTTVLVTSLNGPGSPASTPGTNGHGSPAKGAATAPPSPVVPWIVRGPGIRSGHNIKQAVSIIDTGATVLRIFGLETHTEWQSQAVEEVFDRNHPSKGAPARAHDQQ